MVRYFDGVTSFNSISGRLKVIRAIYRSEKEIAIELENEYDDGSKPIFTGVLKSPDGKKFKGEFTGKSETLGTADARAQLFWSDDQLLLVGSWREDGYVYDWLVMLDELDS